MVGGDIGGPQADIYHVGQMKWLLPETARRDQVHRMNGRDIVDQQVQPAAGPFRQRGEGCGHRIIVAMVAQ